MVEEADNKQTIRDIIHDLLDDVHVLSTQSTEPDEFVAVNDIEIAIHEAEKTFERTKNINNK